MRRRAPSRGFSLLEAIIAVGIFVASMAFIGQLMDVGLRLTDLGKEQTQAVLRCESTMEEIVAGIRPIKAELLTGAKDDPADPRWKLAVEREETNVRGLWRITVRVAFHENKEASADEEPKLTESLTRLVVDRTPSVQPEGRRGQETSVTLPSLMGLESPTPRETRGGGR
ncbi:hypothetical protein K2X85_05740 [bacterium]|jgi:hypothetical protein|nr:hypothetical protein [bacterium]